jgi:hypothetical protein
MRNTDTGTLYRSKVIATGAPYVTNCHGLPLVMRSDDNEVLAELHRRGLWPVFEPGVKREQTLALLAESPQGVDAFLWIGDPNDGGFCWWTLVGGRPCTPACDLLVSAISKLMNNCEQAALYGKDGTPWQF